MRVVIYLLFCILSLTMPLMAQENRDGVVLKGQVACGICWTEADRSITPYGTAEDLKCAIDCQAEGASTILAVKTEQDTILYQLEFGKLKKTKNEWLDYTAKMVEVSGIVQEKNGKRYLKVNTLKVLSEPPALQQTNTASSEGSEAPEMVLKDLNGVSQSLKSYRGKIVVLNFWATWCAPCKAEMPVFIKIQNGYAAFGVQVIAASADEVTKRDAVIKAVRESGMNFPIWLGATTNEMASVGVGPAIPATIIIDRNGKIAALFQGVVTEAELNRQLDKLLSEPVKESSEAEPQQTSTEIATSVKSSSVPS